VMPGGHRCPCGNRGCWEQYASGNALEREARELIAARSPVAHHLAEICAGDPSRLSGPLVTEAARDGDPLSMELLADVGRWLGTGAAGLVAAFDPNCIVVGGGVSDAGELLLGPTREAMVRALVGRGHRSEPSVVLAELGPSAGFIGAADMARSAARRSRRADRRRDRQRERQQLRQQLREQRGEGWFRRSDRPGA
jgi:glucokinase